MLNGLAHELDFELILLLNHLYRINEVNVFTVSNKSLMMKVVVIKKNTSYLQKYLIAVLIAVRTLVQGYEVC
jgi:hypothetical protein